MTKCDFCSKYNPTTRKCEREYWESRTSCDEAAKRFLSFQRSRNTRTHTKNINVNKKSYHKKYNGKKR